MRYLLPRFLLSVVMLLALSFLVFCGVYYLGDPIALLIPQEAQMISLEKARALLGLEGGLLAQYLAFLKGLLTGDLGQSFVLGRPCFEIILERLPASFELAILALIFSGMIGVKAGLFAARFPDKVLTKCIHVYAILGLSFPVYWLALLLVSVFAAKYHFFPALGRGEVFFGLSFLTFDGIRHMVLPLLVLIVFKTALFIRISEHYASTTSQKNFIRFSRARGLSEDMLYKKHILKQLSLPLTTIFSLEFGSLLLSAVITETVFAWPGLGKLLIDSLLQLDRPIIIAFILFVGIFYTILYLILDIIHFAIDPRIRRSKWA